MHHAQIVAYGAEGRLLDLLREVAGAGGLWLREANHVKTCLGLLRKGGPGAVVLKLGMDLERELSLLEQVSRLFPAAAVLVVGHAEHPALEALCWDLGARYVLFP